MILKQDKIKARVLFIVALASIVLMAISFWNYIKLGNKHYLAVLSLVFLALSLISVCWLFIIYLKETNEATVNELINEKVEEERAKILAEFSKKEEEIDEVKVDIDELVTKIIPKGNFKNTDSFVSKLLQNLAPEIEMSQGLFYLLQKDKTSYEFLNGYAITKEEIQGFKAGENLTGQVAVSKEIMVIHEIPDEYITIESGLGKGKPVHLLIAPFTYENEVVAILEIATFTSKTDHIVEVLNKLTIQVSEKLVQMIKS
jgi:hypothetical protein